jgi:DNA mismatch repair ATPase MutS
MNVFLMYKDRDFDVQAPLPWNAKELGQDLELQTLLGAMSCDDKLVLEVSRRALLISETDVQTIAYRQRILDDCLRNPQVIRELYDLTQEAIERRRKCSYGIFGRYPSAILSGSIELLQVFSELLRHLRGVADSSASTFTSEGFTSLFAMLKQELSDEYLALVAAQLSELRLRSGALVSARLGDGNKGIDHVLRRPKKRSGLLTRLREGPQPSFSFRIADRDEGGARALGEMRDRGINPVANALAQSADHIVSFFTMLRVELAFYIGCLNLHEKFSGKGLPVCIPHPVEADKRTHVFMGLYDACLALTLEGGVVGNDVQADGKDLFIITGANQGGKSTFLRSIGLAQLMMQCGMYVAAERFRANICHGVFTHCRREEDASMKSGKFDEELSRMSGIVDHISRSSLVLFNESFSATNEREGSQIARQIVAALLDRGIKVLFVTHMYELAHGFHDHGAAGAIFLRAERQSDGTRTFKLTEGEPLPTSFGRDLYERIFEVAQETR